MEVGKHIREERERMGLSQEGLAREVFVSRQTVSNWETGKTYPDVQSLLLLSNLFGVTVDSLVKGDVEAMEKNIENYELERFKIKASMGLALSLIAVGGVMQAMLAARGELTTSPLRFIALLMLVAGVAVSFVAERIERRYNIETLQEVQAFLDGKEPDQIERDRRMPTALRIVLQMAAGAAVAVLFMMVVSFIVALTMFD
jgi:transcriptional regulator with XRE-family HTH domain